MSVSLSAGLPLCFPIKSICLSFQWSDRLPITQATGSLSSQPSVSLSVYPVIAQAGRLSGFQCVHVFSSVSPAFLSVCLSIRHVISTPISLHMWSWTHSSLKTTSPATTRLVPQREQSRQPSPPAPVSTPQPPRYSLSLPPTALPPHLLSPALES